MQPEVKPELIVRRLHTFSRALRQLHLLGVLIGSLDCPCLVIDHSVVR